MFQSHVMQQIYKSRILRFLIVWVLSTFVELVALYSCVEFLWFDIFISIIIAFLLALIHSFFLNKIWTFQDKSWRNRRLFVKFFIVSSIGFILTLVFMYVFIVIFDIYYLLAKVFTTGIVVVWNFLWNQMWTFRKKQMKKLKVKHSLTYSIVIPAYNEADRIWNTLQKVDNFFQQNAKSYEIIVVDDGSKDNTVDIVYSGWYENVKVLVNPENKGKWYAVKTGVLQSKGKYILFIDADNSTPIEEFPKLLQYVKEYDVIIGSRFVEKSIIQKRQPLYRVLIGRGGNFLIRNFLVDGIKDTQCGFKLFKRKAALDIFSKQKVEWFGFDMELLLIADFKWYTIKEVWVRWINSENSRVRPVKDAIRTLYELFYIKLNYWFDWYK